MRGLALVAIVAILAVAVLLYVWTDRRRVARRAELRHARKGWERAEVALVRLDKEVRLQEQAGIVDLAPIRLIIDTHDSTKEIPS